MNLLRYALALACAFLIGAPPAGARTVSEAEQLAAGLGRTATLLQCDERSARDIMRRALDFGAVRAVTVNENGVLERSGVATRLAEGAGAGAAGGGDAERDAGTANIAGGYVGGEIDLRFNFANWRYAFAVEQPESDGWTTRSLQFFDASGAAVHKLYVTSEAAAGLFGKLAADFRAPEQRAPLNVQAATPDKREVSSEPEGLVARVAPSALRQLLDESARQKLPLMVFLGNGAVTQIYSGVIGDPAVVGEWLEAQAPGFKLRLRERALKGGYVVQRAGVMSVEFFDREGDPVVSFTNVRERGRPETPAWQELLRSLPKP